MQADYMVDEDVMLKVIDTSEEELLQQRNREAWEQIYAARQNNSIMRGVLKGIEVISDKLCGIIMVGDVKGIMPLELSGFEEAHQLKDYVGQEIYFKIIGLERDVEIFSASRKAAVDHLTGITWDKIREGLNVEAIIRRVQPKQLRVEVGGIEINLNPEDIAYEWIDNLNDRYKVGDRINVKVVKFDKKEKVIKLSAKALVPNPFPDCTRRYKIDGQYEGKVTGTTEYGVFINLEPGVDLLSPRPKTHEVGKIKKGDKVVVRIKDIDVKAERIKGRITRKI